MVELWCDCLGQSEAEKIMAGLNRRPHITLRVNTLKISRDELIEKLKSEGISACAASDCDSAVVLDVDCPIDALHINEGLCYVQDISSQLCVKALGVRPDSTVIDTCSCPGGKSFGAAINMQNVGSVISFDLHMSKLSLIKSGAERLGIDIISVREQDGRKTIPDLTGSADRVLCEVPCSGFGVLAKKPELRYKDPAVSDALPKIQLDILNNACQYVKRGGILVYSTCTVFAAENQDNIKLFLKSHPDFELTPFRIGELFVSEGYITFMPDEYPTDGFFIAKLTRK
jgi:16S rRNA (cytosine967-C5)-methyltransferase